jgi:Fe-S cluster assembly ATPase SufC
MDIEINDKIISEHIEKIKHVIYEDIKENEINILVGANGVGKSLVRKQMVFPIVNNHPNAKNKKGLVKSISMQFRTESRPEWGALSSMSHDSPYRPTSVSTFDLYNHLISALENEGKSFLIIDEPEIGMSKETQLAMAEVLKKAIPMLKKKSYGVLIITHSEIIVEALKEDCNFINLGYNTISYDVNEWLNREVVATDFNFLKSWSETLFVAIRDKSKTVSV